MSNGFMGEEDHHHLSLLQARATAREQTKWLMVNIQDPTEFTCQMLNRDLWSDETVKEFVRESFVFLQVRWSACGR